MTEMSFKKITINKTLLTEMSIKKVTINKTLMTEMNIKKKKSVSKRILSTTR